MDDGVFGVYGRGHGGRRSCGAGVGSRSLAGTFRRRWMEHIYASNHATGLPSSNVKWESLLEYADVAGGGIFHIEWDDFLHGLTGIWLLPGTWPVLHGTGSATATQQLHGMSTGASGDAGYGISQSARQTDLSMVG